MGGGLMKKWGLGEVRRRRIVEVGIGGGKE